MYKRLMILLVTLFSSMIVYAQGAPQQIDAALADLSTRVGRTVALNDPQITNWLWFQETYPDASLGCPEDGQAYAQQQIVAYRFEITFAGTVYDYRVSGDSTIVVLCGTSDPNSDGDTTAAPRSDYTNLLCPLPGPGEPNYMRSLMAPGIQGRVVPGGANRLRPDATVNNTPIGDIPGGAIFSVESGPRCADGIVWWYVNYDGVTGWTAEGEDGEYFIEPSPSALLPDRVQIAVDNAADLIERGRLKGNFVPLVDWSPDGTILAVPGDLGLQSLLLYETQFLDQSPRILPGDLNFLSMAYSPDDSGLVLLGTESGTIRLWDTAPDAGLVERLFLQTHQNSVRAVAWSPDGNRFATAGTNAVTTVNVDKSNAILIWDKETVAQVVILAGGHSGDVLDMAYSPDGARLVSVSEDSLIIWDAVNGGIVTEVERNSPARTVAYSPNAQFIAAGTDNGTIELLEAATGNLIAIYTGHTGVVRSVAFNPESTLLATTGDDGRLNIWGTQSDIALTTLEVLLEPGLDLAFSPDGSVIALAARDNTVRLFVVPLAGG